MSDNMEALSKLTQEQATVERVELELSAAIIECLPDAIVVADEQGKIFRVNRETELLFGYSRRDLIGQAVEILMPETVRQAHCQHRADYLHEPRTRTMGSAQLFAQRRDGTKFAADISLSPIPTERGLFVITIIRRSREKAGA